MRGTLFTSGRFYTQDPARPQVEALAVSSGRIVALGSTSELVATFSTFTRVDLGGGPVLPGFVDSHIHLAGYGMSLRRVNLGDAHSLAEAVERVRTAVQRETPGSWIRGRGWDKNLWPEDRFPTKADLDPISPHHPVALSSKDGHLLWVNSAALRKAGIDRRTPDPRGGEITRDAPGEPTGILKELAKELVWKAVPPASPEVIEQGIRDATTALHRYGIVGVHSFVGTEAYEGPPTFAALQRLHGRGELKLRVWMTIPVNALDLVAGSGLRTGFGNDWVRVGPLKIFADGTLGSQTASMLGPFDGQLQNTGIAIFTREQLTDFVGRAVAAGLWCAIHAIGDRANRWALDAYEAHHTDSQRIGARHRIEHVQLLHPDDLPRLARLGITASMQPIHCTSDRDIAERYWGRRSRYAYAWRSLLDAGTVLAFGSDAPVETPDVFQGIYAAVTRLRSAEPDVPAWYPEEALSVAEAVRAYTVGAAFASGEEAKRGTLGEGRWANFVVLDRDILRVPPAEILHTRVVATVIGGEVVYAAPEFRSF